MMIEVHSVVFLNLLIYVIIAFITYKGIKKNRIRKTDYQKILLLFLVFCLFPAWGGDYFHYREIFEEVRLGAETHMESVYAFVIHNITPTYFLFRLVVWGSAIYLLVRTYKNVNVNYFWAIAVFCFLFMHRFSYARVSLAMAITYFALSIYAKKENIKRFLLCLAILFSALFFHKTAAFGVAMALISILVAPKMNKWIVIVALSLLPVVVIVVQQFLDEFMLITMDDTELFSAARAQRALGSEEVTLGLANRIDNLLMRLTYYSVMLEYVILIFNGQYKHFPSSIKLFATASFLTILSASIFSFDIGFSTTVIYNRFIFFGMIPSALFVAYCLENNLLKKWTRMVLGFGLLSVLYSLLYAYYLSFVSNTFTM